MEPLEYLLAKVNLTDRTGDERKTFGEVFDERTVRIILKLINSGDIIDILYPVSTGKEANIFCGKNSHGLTAIKIYRIATTSFRSIYNYIDGDRRFTNFKHNIKDMIFLWARKEYKNLMRMRSAGISVPEAYLCRGNILIMEYIGNEDSPSFTLKDMVDVDYERTYRKITDYMKLMYKKARLVHSDLSEYNILMRSEAEPVIIDVAQAVLIEHPNSMEFLNRDVKNINNYFRKHVKKIYTDKELIDYIVK